MPPSLARRLLDTMTPSAQRFDTSAMRIEVPPPVDRRRVRSWRQRLRTWLFSGFGQPDAYQEWPAARRKDPDLPAARAAFHAALHDIESAEGVVARQHIDAARSLHELWHLRAEVFSLVSRRHDQGSATRRLARLDAHFDSRARPVRLGAAGRKDRI